MRFALFLTVTFLLSLTCFGGLEEDLFRPLSVVNEWRELPDYGASVLLTGEVDEVTKPGTTMHLVKVRMKTGAVQEWDVWVSNEVGFPLENGKGQILTVTVRNTDKGPVMVFTIMDE